MPNGGNGLSGSCKAESVRQLSPEDTLKTEHSLPAFGQERKLSNESIIYFQIKNHIILLL